MLNALSPVYLHVFQNLCLITIALLVAPLCTFITICSLIASPYTDSAKHIEHKRKQCASSSSKIRPRVILVTGVGMSKGLCIARAFYREGHRVIGADFEPFSIPVCGRFSKALDKFYRLSKPVLGSKGTKIYVEGLLKIVQHENVHLWVSCSGVASAVEDAEAAEAIEKLSSCNAIQLGPNMTKTLDEKHTFIEQTKRFGLKVPETHLIISVDDAMGQLYPSEALARGKQFIMKSVGLDDAVRADMTLLPRPSSKKTREHLDTLKPSASRPFVLQQFIRGPEYCTHSVLIRGRVAVFTASPSAELLMHYEALPSTSPLCIAMQRYTELYAEKMGSATGHFSIDFMLDDQNPAVELLDRLYPIECNPRAHTAVALLEDRSKDMVDAYLSAIENEEAHKHNLWAIVTPSSKNGYYWIGHDVVTCALLPLFSTLSSRSGFGSLIGKWQEFKEHVLYWKDGTYVIWDPLPFWWLYCVYWPAMFISAVLTRNWWSRCNVSTTKMFRC